MQGINIAVKLKLKITLKRWKNISEDDMRLESSTLDDDTILN